MTEAATRRSATDPPEMQLVRRALVPGAIAIPALLAAGWAIAGPGAGISAALGAAVVLANFAAHGASLAWASRISVALVQAVALGGVVLRIGVIVAAMFALNALPWFSPVAFGLTLVPGTVALLAYEARGVVRGIGAQLEIPADPAALRAAESLAAKEAAAG
jgi:hypothetical protein